MLWRQNAALVPVDGKMNQRISGVQTAARGPFLALKYIYFDTDLFTELYIFNPGKIITIDLIFL